MALMEDTGWYLPNYDMAEPLKWGAGLGCDFALKSCKEWMDDRTRKRKSIHPYCNKVRGIFFRSFVIWGQTSLESMKSINL